MPKQLSRNRGMHRNASDSAADQLDGNNVLSGYENNSLSGSAHDLCLEDDFSITKTEVVNRFSKCMKRGKYYRLSITGWPEFP